MSDQDMRLRVVEVGEGRGETETEAVDTTRLRVVPLRPLTAYAAAEAERAVVPVAHVLVEDVEVRVTVPAGAVPSARTYTRDLHRRARRLIGRCLPIDALQIHAGRALADWRLAWALDDAGATEGSLLTIERTGAKAANGVRATIETRVTR
jgi:hypothetical protein